MVLVVHWREHPIIIPTSPSENLRSSRMSSSSSAPNREPSEQKLAEP